MDSIEIVKKEMSNVINRMSIDSCLNIPDYILAEYLLSCLRSLDNMLKMLNKHNGKVTE